MRKAILPLLIIITMVLSASVASATDFDGSGIVNTANGWTNIQGNWYDAIPGVWTDGNAYASHPVATQASGQFEYWVLFKIVDPSNEVKAGLIAGGHEYAVEYKNGKFYFDGNELGINTNAPTNNYWAAIKSNDGKVWTGCVYGGVSYERAVTVNAVPTAATIGLVDNAGEDSPVIYNVNFDSPGAPAGQDPTPTPTASPTPTPSEQPAAGGSSQPMYDPQQVQYFYDHYYPLIGSPYDTVTYNDDGTFTVTPGYPTSNTHHVSGTVTSAADGSPIEGASVVLGDALQKTGDDGRFRFNGISDGSVDVAVSADGFASQTVTKNVNADTTIDFALDSVATGGSTIASAQNESGNVTMDTNATIEPTMAPTEAPTATQTQSPGFEGIVAAIAMVGAAGALVYLHRKR